MFLIRILFSVYTYSVICICFIIILYYIILSKSDEPDMHDTAEEAGTSS